MKVLVGGDYVPINRILQKLEHNDYSFFGKINEYTREHDLSILNLEAPITIKDSAPLVKHGPNLKAPYNTLNSLIENGFKMVTLANNHILDYGDIGLLETLNLCKKFNIETVGAGKNIVEASAIKYYEKNGSTIAIINCCEHEFSIANKNRAGACPLDLILQYNQITEAKRNADYVLLIVHGGHERYQYPSKRMVETYRHFIELGADAVINHHQHCFSGYEVYKNKPIFYGLGNLCFDKFPNISSWHEGYLVSLQFGDSINFSIIPYRQCLEAPIIDFIPKDEYRSQIQEINNSLADLSKLEKLNQSYYEQDRITIQKLFEPYHGKILNKLFSMGLLPSFLNKKRKMMLSNYINCEAHRDKLTYILKSDTTGR